VRAALGEGGRVKALYDRLKGAGTDMSAHMDTLRDAVIEADAQQVIELGVRSGVSTVALLSGLEQTGGSLWSCDVGHVTVPAEVSSHPAWTLVHGDDVSAEVQRLAPPSCDVLFIDTSHTEKHTFRELAAYGPKLKPGGIVICHDTCDDGVIRPLWEWYRAKGVSFTDRSVSYGLAVVRT
jgi:predicted O-methyltransferase YrrM